MAEKSGQEKPLHELRQEVAHSRERLAEDLSGMRYELDFPLKFRSSFQRQTVVWIVAATALGLVLAVRSGRKKRVYVQGLGAGAQKKGLLEAGLAIGALKFAATLLRPFLLSFVSRKLGGMAGGASRARRW